ncbi:hypothetical protein Bpfe_030620, partial [Biomphalaria pfeifferi]
RKSNMRAPDSRAQGYVVPGSNHIRQGLTLDQLKYIALRNTSLDSTYVVVYRTHTS